MRFTNDFIIPLGFGATSGTAIFLTWRAMYSNSTEGMVFMICACACVLFLGFILIHYQNMLRKVLRLEAYYARHKENPLRQYSQFRHTAPAPDENHNTATAVHTDKSDKTTSQTDILGIDPLAIAVKKCPEESNLTNVVQLHSPEETSARRINAKNKIIINLQAVIKLNERSIQAYEVLARMETKNGTYKSATEIFESFKKKAEYHYLDKTILEQTVEVLDCLEKDSDLVMHINISKETLESKTAFNKYYGILNDHISTCKNLILEISQQQFASLSAASRNRLFSLTELGFRLSIDNCTDYISLLSLVEEHQIAVIKTPVTKFFEINNVVHEQQITAFMKRCAANDVPFIVTHVDEGYQLQELIKYNVIYAQGFLFSAPKRPTSKVN